MIIYYFTLTIYYFTFTHLCVKKIRNIIFNLIFVLQEFLQIPSGPLQSQARHEKLRVIISMLLKDESSYELNIHIIDDGLQVNKTPFYLLCLNEACVQICLLKPALLTRKFDLIAFGQNILENCFNSSNNKR